MHHMRSAVGTKESPPSTELPPSEKFAVQYTLAHQRGLEPQEWIVSTLTFNAPTLIEHALVQRKVWPDVSYLYSVGSRVESEVNPHAAEFGVPFEQSSCAVMRPEHACGTQFRVTHSASTFRCNIRRPRRYGASVLLPKGCAVVQTLKPGKYCCELTGLLNLVTHIQPEQQVWEHRFALFPLLSRSEIAENLGSVVVANLCCVAGAGEVFNCLLSTSPFVVA